MSVNLNPRSSSSTANSQPIDENIAPENVPDQGSSPFDRLPNEILQKIFQSIPLAYLKESNIGPNRVNKRFEGSSAAVFQKKSFKSPIKNAHPTIAEPLKHPRAPMKKRRPSNFSRKVIPLNLDPKKIPIKLGF